MTSVEYHVTSYDSGRKPFIHDSKRGKWSSSRDFFFACIGQSFGCMHFTQTTLILYWSSGLFALVPMIVFMMIYSVPMFVIQSFLGQFSSTGYISAFRIAPLMKGIGYIILIVNMISIAYGSLLSSIPLIFVFNSFAFNLPWMSCDNNYNTINCTTIEIVKKLHAEFQGDSENENESSVNFYDTISSAEYYRYFIHDLKFSWPIFVGLLIVWSLSTFILLQGIEWLGLLFRKMCIIMVSLLLLLLFRSFFLITDWSIFSYFSQSQSLSHLDLWLTVPIILAFAMKASWGNVISLASYNKFNSNIINWSWTVCVTIIIINFLSGLFMAIIDKYAEEQLEVTGFFSNQLMEYVFNIIPLALGTFEFPNIWILLFFSMIFIGEMFTIVIQLHSIVTALCDEFENFRDIRREITAALILIQMLLSITFCFNRTFDLFDTLLYSEIFIQQILCLLLIVVVLWIYGRVRFQRDFKILNNMNFSKCKIFIIRFITPLIILLLLLWTTFEISMQFVYSKPENTWVLWTAFIVISLFFGFMPIYIILKLLKITGTIGTRIRSMLRPTDWYPAESEDRQRYEENLGVSDISHQLVLMTIDLDT